MSQQAKYIVVVSRGSKSVSVGPYTTLKAAAADAKTWDNTDGLSAFVEPLLTPQGYAEERAAACNQ